VTPRRIWLASCALAALSPAAALQAQTNIAADVSPALSLGTVAVKNGTIVDITGGTGSGPNLFHSFSRFDLANGDTARWLATSQQATGVQNLVNRVTGGTASTISGTLDTTSFANANVYFLNPAGVIFGFGARLNVPNAIYVSTARELAFASGPTFTMTTPQGGSFSIDAPAKFGFVGARGNITVDRVTSTFMPSTGALHLSGGDESIWRRSARLISSSTGWTRWPRPPRAR